ncbi:uncharacterized protein LOC114289681 [Camellia sinensis]|uniref:uncharacterized protein LOC114289681 n=1 Tax=Camellia sinensis TaxID=4442 RepID=UPI001036A9A6|nr:uncharacterized protein LOC114289681 [Camellia sinensis]
MVQIYWQKKLLHINHSEAPKHGVDQILCFALHLLRFSIFDPAFPIRPLILHRAQTQQTLNQTPHWRLRQSQPPPASVCGGAELFSSHREGQTVGFSSGEAKARSKFEWVGQEIDGGEAEEGGEFCDSSGFIAEDLKKTAKKGSNLGGLNRKLFGKGSEMKALTEVKSNTRTLAMVLRSERELLSQKKEQEVEITDLKLMVEEKNREVEKLKDLCLKQREEIKALKNAVLFPDAMNSQFQELWEKQGSELKQAKRLIPSLHRQVTSLTGQLQCLAEDLAEVKADKYSVRRCYDNLVSSPRTLAYDQEDTPNSLEFEALGCDSSPDERFSRNNMQLRHEIGFDFCVRKMLKSSDCCQCSNSSGSTSARPARRSGESKCTYGKQMNHKFLSYLVNSIST